MLPVTRRDLLKRSLGLGGAVLLAGPLGTTLAKPTDPPGAKMRLGLCTYLWGANWDLPTVIANCEASGVLGVELRTQHKHGVEPNLSAQQRREVKQRFADSPVAFNGPGTNECYHHVDPQALRRAIENTKAYVKLSYDLGGSGVKVKPNDLPKGVPQQKTTEQIGRSLNALGEFAAGFGQQIRLEVHGGCARLPVIKEIMDVADHPNVGVCWNCNEQDLEGKGLEYNFNLVKDRLGDTTHVRELNVGNYPYQELIGLLVQADYPGWVLLECRRKVEDGVAAMIEQRQVFAEMVAKAQGELAAQKGSAAPAARTGRDE